MANEFKIKKGLIVTGASGGTVVDIQGSQGQLFSVTDDLSGSIFAVSDISGVPILDVNSTGLVTVDGPFTQTGGEATTLSGTLDVDGEVTIGSGEYLSWGTSGATAIEGSTVSNRMRFYTDSTLALTLESSQNATFAGDVNANLNITAGSYSRVAGTTVSILTDAQQNSVLKFREDNDNYGFTLGYYGSPNNFVLTRHDNSAAGDTVMSIPRNSSAVTFSTQAFATTATSSGDASSTLTTKGYVDGLITGATIYRGAWDPSGGSYGSPDLSGVTQTSGYYYICSAAGTAEPNGTGCEPDSWETGDWVIWNDDIVDCAGTGTGGWQKIDNSSVLSGAGTGQTVALWEGASSVTDSETLGNAPITVDGNNVNFADSISVADSARFEGTTSPITIGDGFGYGGTATICKHNGPLYLQYNNGQTATDLNIGGGGTAVRINDSENNNYRFTSDSADSYVLSGGGDFGIGVTNPNATLHVKNDAAGITARIQQGADGEESAIRFQTLDGTTPRYTDIAQSATTGNLDFRAPYNATTPNLTIKNGGDVGINISDPQTQLHISGGTPNPNSTAITSTTLGLAISGNDGLMDLLSYDDNTTVATSIGMGRYNQTTGNLIDKWGLVTWYDTGNEGTNLSEKISLHYGTNGTPWSSTEMVTVLRDGNVGIGTSTPLFNTGYNGVYNQGLNIDTGGHSSLLIGDGVNDGGMIQSSDNAQRLIITANAYDQPNASWSRFTADGAALIDVYGEGNGAFISLNVDSATSGFPEARLTVSNTGGIQFNTYSGTNKTGTPTYLLGTDASGNIVKTLSFDPPTGTTQFFNQSNQYNNSTPGITGFGNVSMDTSVSYYDTGKNVLTTVRGLVWTGKHYIITDYNSKTAKFYDNNFNSITNPEASSITLPLASGVNFPHGATWDGRYLYVIQYSTNSSDATIVVYDLDNGTTTATIVNTQALNSLPATFDVEYAEGHLYTCTGGAVSKYKVEGKNITHVFTSTNILGGINAQAITYDGSYLWFTQNGNYAYKVSLDCVLVATITTGLPANNVAWAWNGQNVASVNHSTGDIYIVNTAETRFDTEEFLVMGGNVGIGTDSPGEKLEVNTAAQSAIMLRARYNANYYTDYGSNQLNFTGANQSFNIKNNGNSALFINSAGNIGINQTNISAVDTNNGIPKLQVNTSTALAGEFPLAARFTSGTDAGDNSGVSVLINSGNDRGLMISAGREVSNVAKVTLNVVDNNGDEIDTITMKQSSASSTETNVGIGTSTPNAKLDVQGTQGQLFSVTDDLSGDIFSVADISGVPIMNVNSDGTSYFDGNVMMGKTSQSGNAALTVKSTAGGNTGIILVEGDTTNDGWGVYATTANKYIITRFTDGSYSDKFTILEGGNVGIGTTNPSHKLEVGLTSTVGLSSQPAIPLMVSNNGNSVDGRVFIQVKNDVVNTAAAIGAGLQMTAAGVTSGTASYENSLIFLQSKSPGNQTIHSAPQNIKFYVDNDGTTAGAGANYNDFGDLSFELQEDGDGIFYHNVGIGTTLPQSKLHVETGSGGVYTPNSNHDDITIEGSGNIGLQLFSPNTTYQYIAFGDPDSVNAGYIRYYHGSNEMVLRTNGSDHLRINSAGDVGIGGNAPSYLLDVRDGTSSGAIARFSAINAHVIIESSTAGPAVLHLKPNATGNKSGQFKVTTGEGYNFRWSNDAASTAEVTYMTLDTSTTGGGDLTVKGDIIAYGAPSDERYKENIKPIESALDKVEKLQGVTFDWKENDSILDIKEDIGFIAQDVQKVVPELVRENEDGKLSLRYQGITPILLEAIKELKEEIEELKKQIK